MGLMALLRLKIKHIDEELEAAQLALDHSATRVAAMDLVSSARKMLNELLEEGEPECQPKDS